MPDHNHAHHGHSDSPPRPFWTSRAFLVFLAFAAMALVLLWQEHRAHILGSIPYLFLLACPLMHIFMHGGHGKHRGPGPPLESADRIARHMDGGSHA